MKRRIMSVISCLLVILLMTQPVFALSPTAESDERIIAENIAILENALEENQTDVVNELNKMIEQYEEMLVSATTEEKSNQIGNLIATLEELIADYQLYDAGISTYKFHAIYTPAVASVIAYFNVKNYLLAAELLTHAKENTDKISIYTPTYGARARNSSVVQQIGYGTVDSGSSAFEPGDSPVDMDLYYAIHSFDFFKSSPSSRVVNIFDTYDFEHDEDAYKTIPGIAVETMYRAQEAGVLTPYFVLFEVAV